MGIYLLHLIIWKWTSFFFFEQDDGSSENAYKEFKLEENPKYQHLVRNVSHVWELR